MFREAPRLPITEKPEREGIFDGLIRKVVLELGNDREPVRAILDADQAEHVKSWGGAERCNVERLWTGQRVGDA